MGVRRLSSLEVCKELWWSIQRFGSRKFAKDRIKYRPELFERIKKNPKISTSLIDRCQESIAFAEFRATLPENFFIRCPIVFWRGFKGNIGGPVFGGRAIIFVTLFTNDAVLASEENRCSSEPQVPVQNIFLAASQQENGKAVVGRSRFRRQDAVLRTENLRMS